MKTSSFFKEGKNNIGWIGLNFQENFGNSSFTIPQELKLESRKLERAMLDKEILDEFKPEESTLGELAYAIKNDLLVKDGYSNIFYIKDDKGVLWAVRARWGDVGRAWVVEAYSVEDPVRWISGRHALSRKFGSRSLGNSELPDVLEINGVKYKRI